jgi:hypothetical protein
VIDLDLPPPAPRRRFRFRFPRPHRLVRPVLTGLCAVAVVLTLGAAGHPKPGLARVLSVDSTLIDDQLLTPDALYSVEMSEAEEGPATVRARPLAPGGPSWTTVVPYVAATLTLTLRDRAGVLIAGVAGAPPATFLDAATGARLWRVGGAGVLVTDQATVAVVTQDPDATPSKIRVADLRTGRTRWTRKAASAVAVDLDGAGHLIVVDIYGWARTYRLTDGRVVASADLGGGERLWNNYGTSEFAAAEIVAGRLYVRQLKGDRASLRAFGPA